MAVGDLYLDRDGDIWEEVDQRYVECRRALGEWYPDSTTLPFGEANTHHELVRLVPETGSTSADYVTREELSDAFESLEHDVRYADDIEVALVRGLEELALKFRGAR